MKMFNKLVAVSAGCLSVRGSEHTSKCEPHLSRVWRSWSKHRRLTDTCNYSSQTVDLSRSTTLPEKGKPHVGLGPEEYPELSRDSTSLSASHPGEECYICRCYHHQDTGETPINSPCRTCIEQHVHKSCMGTWLHKNLKCPTCGLEGANVFIEDVLDKFPDPKEAGLRERRSRNRIQSYTQKSFWFGCIAGTIFCSLSTLLSVPGDMTILADPSAHEPGSVSSGLSLGCFGVFQFCLAVMVACFIGSALCFQRYVQRNNLYGAGFTTKQTVAGVCALVTMIGGGEMIAAGFLSLDGAACNAFNQQTVGESGQAFMNTIYSGIGVFALGLVILLIIYKCKRGSIPP